MEQKTRFVGGLSASLIFLALLFQNCSSSFQADRKVSNLKLVSSKGQECLSSSDIIQFQKCMDGFVPAMNTQEKACYYGFQTAEGALSFKNRLTNNGDLHVVQMGGVCQDYYPGSYSLLNAAQLESSRQSLFNLHVNYGVYKNFLKENLPGVVDLYLTDFDTTSSTRLNSCGRDYDVIYFFYAKNWPMLRYLFDAIVNAKRIVQGEVEESDLKVQLDRHLKRIADHVIAHANTSFYHGLSGDFIGWNDLNSEWDGFNNCTFSPPTEPNLYSAANALYVLAKMYELSKDPRYIDAFEHGARYWHEAQRSSSFTDLPSNIYGPFSLGSTGYDSQLLDSQGEPPIRYHYHFDDPGRYSLNCIAAMAEAMTVAGYAKAEGAFPIPSVKSPGQNVPRLWRELGLQTIAVVAANIQNKNYGYYDITDPQFTGYYTGAAGAGYSTYLDTELTSLLIADDYLGKKEYEDLVRQATEEVLDNPSYVKSGLSGFRLSLHGACQIRKASARADAECEALFQEYYNREGSYERVLGNPYILWAITR